jgi:tetratricopeptide (TPR) repeat protein
MYGTTTAFTRDEHAAARDRDADGADLPSSLRRRHTDIRELERRRAPEPAAVERCPEHDKLLQAARICLRRGRAEDAFTLMEQACAVAPHNLQYQALLAWLRVERGDVRPEDDAQPIAELLTRAVHEHPDDLEIRLYRARSLQRLGRSADALLDFAFVANADPRNVEAARELRLHRMRSTPAPAPAAVRSGFFSRSPNRAPRELRKAAGGR